jgi:hypothetical protein
VLTVVLVVGCSGTQASRGTNLPNCRPELSLDEKQKNYIEDSIAKLFQWDSYWTGDDEDSRSSYNQKVGEKANIIVINLKQGIVVFVPSCGNAAIKFRKSMNGDISNPQYLRGGVDRGGDSLIGIAKVLGDWQEFLKFTGRDADIESYPFPRGASDQEMKMYIEQNRPSIGYCEIHGEITYLPQKPTYDSMDERKEAILKLITDECIKLAQVMFNKGDTVTISIPNFNLNDDRIWVLLEDQAEAYTMSLKMDLADKDYPITFQNTVEIRSEPKYGIRIGADEKIRQAAIKTLEYKVQ